MTNTPCSLNPTELTIRKRESAVGTIRAGMSPGNSMGLPTGDKPHPLKRIAGVVAPVCPVDKKRVPRISAKATASQTRRERSEFVFVVIETGSVKQFSRIARDRRVW